MQKARPDMEVFVGTIVNSTDAEPMMVQNNMVIGVINGKVGLLVGYSPDRTPIYASVNHDNQLTLELNFLKLA